MTDPMRALDDTPAAEAHAYWAGWLILYVRAMAVVSMLKGLYHWAQICTAGDGVNSMFELAPVPWKAATIFFAVIDPVAAVGLWLAAAWGGVVWLTAAISMAAVELLFPNIFGGRIWLVAAEMLAVGAYLGLAIMATRDAAQ